MPLVLAWLVLTVVSGLVLGAIVLVQFTLSRVRPHHEAAPETVPGQDQAAQSAAAVAA
jgi:hypothetical protein